jgi:hypothetical protein
VLNKTEKDNTKCTCSIIWLYNRANKKLIICSYYIYIYFIVYFLLFL